MNFKLRIVVTLLVLGEFGFFLVFLNSSLTCAMEPGVVLNEEYFADYFNNKYVLKKTGCCVLSDHFARGPKCYAGVEQGKNNSPDIVHGIVFDETVNSFNMKKLNINYQKMKSSVGWGFGRVVDNFLEYIDKRDSLGESIFILIDTIIEDLNLYLKICRKLELKEDLNKLAKRLRIDLKSLPVSIGDFLKYMEIYFSGIKEEFNGYGEFNKNKKMYERSFKIAVSTALNKIKLFIQKRIFPSLEDFYRCRENVSFERSKHYGAFYYSSADLYDEYSMKSRQHVFLSTLFNNFNVDFKYDIPIELDSKYAFKKIFEGYEKDLKVAQTQLENVLMKEVADLESDRLFKDDELIKVRNKIKEIVVSAFKFGKENLVVDRLKEFLVCSKIKINLESILNDFVDSASIYYKNRYIANGKFGDQSYDRVKLDENFNKTIEEFLVKLGFSG